MFPKLLCLILYLPLLLLASPPYLRLNFSSSSLTPCSTTAPPRITAPTGDTLNRTACFCVAPQRTTDRDYGFVFLLNYHNAHQNRTYTLEPACRSSLSINVKDRSDPKDKPVMQNICLQSRVNEPMKYCTGKDTGVDVFCYTMAGGAAFDSYTLNGQLRKGLPSEPVVNYTAEVVERVCEESCKEHVDGMKMLKADELEVLEGYYDLVGQTLKSSVVFYPSIPDMCNDCK